jgi:hypothetical protein
VPALAAIPVDTSGVKPGPVQVQTTADTLSVTWTDGERKPWRADFSLDPARPLITAVSVGGRPVIERARPLYDVSTGKRRGGWDQFFDHPPLAAEGTRDFRAQFAPAFFSGTYPSITETMSTRPSSVCMKSFGIICLTLLGEGQVVDCCLLDSAFTMVEIAISLAVIGFALVAIIGVLPRGLRVQRENREETIINQDAGHEVAEVGARRHAEVVLAVRARPQVLFEHGLEQRLSTALALGPQTLGDFFLFGSRSAQFRLFNEGRVYRGVRRRYCWF